MDCGHVTHGTAPASHLLLGKDCLKKKKGIQAAESGLT